MRSSTPISSTTSRAAVLGILACASIGLTAWAVGASEPADEAVDEAKRAATRSAAAESAAEPLEDAPPGGRLRESGRKFKPADLSLLPNDWSAAGLDLEEAERQGDRLVQTLPSGLEVVFTVEPRLQDHIEHVLRDYEVPHGGVVVIEPESGRVLAFVSQSRGAPRMPNLARKSAAPAASTFKVVTAAALLQEAQVDPSNETCYRGGASHLKREHIVGDPGEDANCRDLGDALAHSINAIMAKLAHRHLNRADLRTWARRFGYNSDIPFELPVERSTAEIVREPIERARTAAGFWHTYLSPLHAALISAAVENGGLLLRPSIIEEVRTPEGDVLKTFERKVLQRTMSKATAQRIAELLEGTAEYGTASHRFDERAAFPDDVQAGGKTGTLANHDPYLSFTWYTGFGRHQDESDQDVAVASLVCNRPKWWIKGAYPASEGLRMFYDLRN